MRLLTIISLALGASLMAATLGTAQERETLGYGRIFTNDFFGDNKDRWRSGGYTFSILRGTDWSGDINTMTAPILEYRLRSEIIAPSALNGAGSNDRAYVGALSAGLHAHYVTGGALMSAGVDLVAVGPQTGIADLQDEFHDLVSAPNLSETVKGNQLPNAVYPTVLAQVTYPIALSPNATLRPFIEAQHGVEDILRVGADVMIGDALAGDLWLRDPTTGQLYSGIQGDGVGTGFVIGADYAVIGDSEYFPASFGTQAEDERFRVRAGMHWRFGDDISYFYGLTYLSEEFVGQTQGQVVGSLKLTFSF